MDNIDKNKLNTIILDAAIEVHGFLGPTLPEGLYKECYCKELSLRNIPFRREVPYSINYKGFAFKNELTMDILVAEEIILKIVAVDSSEHEKYISYLNTALRFTDKKTAVLINFNFPKLMDGFKRITKEF
jgi:GxxExxY protein